MRILTRKKTAASFSGTGVNGFVAVAQGGKAGGAFPGGGVDGFQQHLKPDLLVLSHGLREAGLIDREAF